MATNPKRRDDMVVLERIVEECANADGEYRRRDVEQRMHEYVAEHPDPDHIRRTVRQMMDEFEASRKPKSHGGNEQATLWDPDGILILGDGYRVKMCKAQLKHVLAAMRERQKAFDAEAADFKRDMAYWQTRAMAFQSEGETLQDVEDRLSSSDYDEGY